MSKEKIVKTNAMRILDLKKINYEIISYESKDGKIDGVSVAHKSTRFEQRNICFCYSSSKRIKFKKSCVINW